DILFLDSPADEDEVRRAVSAAAGRPSFAVLSPGAPRETPTQARAAELGLKIGTFPTGTLGPAIGAIQAGLDAIAAGKSEAAVAIPPAQLRAALGYADYERDAKQFMMAG
ncbi:MAG: branched-chain alpha-keto acid dehydrogenase subunit E2, partial [Rhodospirillales bacterium]|nr:branched-chain alpha-keto acid dehydrogenase subunit E2 [Rhodospirillales bacterium]